jgi:hypothetical protein
MHPSFQITPAGAGNGLKAERRGMGKALRWMPTRAVTGVTPLDAGRQANARRGEAEAASLLGLRLARAVHPEPAKQLVTARGEFDRRAIAAALPTHFDEFITTQREHVRIEFVQTPVGVTDEHQGRDFVMAQHDGSSSLATTMAAILARQNYSLATWTFLRVAL